MVESLKRMNLVRFLQRVYHVTFRREGDAYVASSPLREETHPSFYVRRERDGHWVFKDHGSGDGGTVFDFVMRREGLDSFKAALSWLRALCRPVRSSTPDPAVPAGGPVPDPADTGGGWKEKTPPDSASQPKGSVDIDGLYERFRQADPSPCGDYLLSRGIAPAVVEQVLNDGTVVLNRFEKGTFCCFAVRDADGQLQGLYNRQIDGEATFLLGKKHPFSVDWSRLPTAATVFLCEGPIDYLSVKTLEGPDLPGLALLGNALNVEPTMIPACRQLITAFDGDRAGFEALFDVREAFGRRCRIHVYELEDHKDPNELLQSRREQAREDLTPERKLEFYRQFAAATNKAAVIGQWQLSRSYAYQIVSECERAILDEFSGRRRGRPRREDAPAEELRAQLAALERRYREAETERERLYCRSEFLALRLKWAEADAAGATPDEDDAEAPSPPKRHTKKKRRKRR